MFVGEERKAPVKQLVPFGADVNDETAMHHHKLENDPMLDPNHTFSNQSMMGDNPAVKIHSASMQDSPANHKDMVNIFYNSIFVQDGFEIALELCLLFRNVCFIKL